jgi:glycosyltransferase involved in cell wall biosynthesis
VARVLLLARHFPPFGGAGVHRTLASVRHLPEHGYEPVVVTGPAREAARNRWEPLDQGLAEQVPADAQVHRVQTPEPVDRTSRLHRALGRRSALASWWIDESARLATAVGSDADVIITSCAPYETAFAGGRIARALGRPWIADLEDPWALDEMRVAPSALHRSVDRRNMRRALAHASGIVMAAPEAAERVRRAWPELAARISVVGIAIGYESSAFLDDAPRAPDGVFRIVHAGSLHTDFGEHLRRTRLRRRLLGGSAPGLDVLTRSHVFIAEAIDRAIAADPTLAGRVELHLAGDMTERDHAVVAGRPYVRTHGLLEHAETVELMRAADVLFLPMHDLPPGARAGLIPYKTYEYLAARRPILAAVPDGDVRDMLAGVANATLVRPADAAAMAEAVRARIAAAAAAGGREPDVAPPERYECRQSVARIAALLDEVRGVHTDVEDRTFGAASPS